MSLVEKHPVPRRCGWRLQGHSVAECFFSPDGALYQIPTNEQLPYIVTDLVIVNGTLEVSLMVGCLPVKQLCTTRVCSENYFPKINIKMMMVMVMVLVVVGDVMIMKLNELFFIFIHFIKIDDILHDAHTRCKYLPSAYISASVTHTRCK